MKSIALTSFVSVASFFSITSFASSFECKGQRIQYLYEKSDFGTAPRQGTLISTTRIRLDEVIIEERKEIADFENPEPSCCELTVLQESVYEEKGTAGSPLHLTVSKAKFELNFKSLNKEPVQENGECIRIDILKP